MRYHFYADDTQLYITFDIDEAEIAISKMEEAVAIIRNWMTQNFLCLNDDKTEVMVIASNTAHKKLSIPHVTIGCEEICPVSNVKNLGFIFDNIMNGKKQVSLICKSAWYHLRNIGKMRKYLDRKSTEVLIHAFVSSKLDINNCLLYGLPDSLLQRLQVVQNTAARLVVRIPKHSHITSTLIDLHWLPIAQRIKLKILMMVFKALNCLAPDYITNMLEYKQKSSHALRSDDLKLLSVPRSNSVTYGDRNFRNAAPILWNLLPVSMRNCQNVDRFKKQLKTYLFHDAYDYV